MVRIGVIGYGYWGPNLVRNFFETPGAQVVCVADKRADRLKGVQARFPTVKVVEGARELIDERRQGVLQRAWQKVFDAALAAVLRARLRPAPQHVGLVARPGAEARQSRTDVFDAHGGRRSSEHYRGAETRSSGNRAAHCGEFAFRAAGQAHAAGTAPCRNCA